MAGKLVPRPLIIAQGIRIATKLIKGHRHVPETARGFFAPPAALGLNQGLLETLNGLLIAIQVHEHTANIYVARRNLALRPTIEKMRARLVQTCQRRVILIQAPVSNACIEIAIGDKVILLIFAKDCSRRGQMFECVLKPVQVAACLRHEIGAQSNFGRTLLLLKEAAQVIKHGQGPGGIGARATMSKLAPAAKRIQSFPGGAQDLASMFEKAIGLRVLALVTQDAAFYPFGARVRERVSFGSDQP